MEALVRSWRAAWKMPFYFTQMQCYGTPDPDQVGFADLRQVQHLFLIKNRDHVGMVVQSDLNSARPAGIHYFNKLHPGMRMARWALARDYGRDLAFTGPIFESYRVEGNQDILIGDVWYLTGSPQLTSESAFNQRKQESKEPITLPLVREFRKKTKASTFATPRKRRFETGGGKYRSSWLPSEFNLGENPAEYAEELEIYAHSLPATYGQEEVPFIYAQPAASLVAGITRPRLPRAKSVTFKEWPASLKDLATEMARMAR